MLIDTNTYLNDIPLSRIPIPDWNHLNVISKETIKLDWDDIYIDHDSNKSKQDAHTAEEIESLRMSFANGVNTSEYPPSVIYRGKQYAKPYQLVYGFGRSEALRLLKTKEWIFTLLEGDEDCIEDVQAAENEGLPKRLNKEVDMRKFLIDKIISGKIEATEAAIRQKFKKVYSGQPKEVANRVVAQVLQQTGVKQSYELYTSVVKIQDWMNNHSKVDYCVGGEYDAQRDMFGMAMKEGYMYRAFMMSLSRYRDTGKKSYVIFHCGAPSEKATLLKKRLAILESFNQHVLDFQNIGATTIPLVIMGFLPQERGVEDWKMLITPEEVKASLPINSILFNMAAE
jgi:hypothetical protein